MTTYKAADISKWSAKAKRNTNLVMRQSVENLANALLAAGRSGGAQGAGIVPVVTGNLRNSLKASVAPINIVEGDNFTQNVSFEINSWNPQTQTILYLGWRAAYAARINYGFTGADSLGRNYNQGGRFFLESHAARWQQYVDEAAAKFRD